MARGGAAYNMALDEALLEAMPRLRLPVLRFYGWTEPAASFGYFQHYRDVEALTLLRPLVRRPTGGGIVPHDADWTYSAAFPADHEWYATRAKESYHRMHEWVRVALLEVGIEGTLAPSARKSLPGQCFVGYEESDVLWKGQKIAGAAQRRTKAGLLIQGSVQPMAPDLSRTDWETAMLDAQSRLTGAKWVPVQPDAELRARTQQLEESKFSRTDYNEKR